MLFLVSMILKPSCSLIGYRPFFNFHFVQMLPSLAHWDCIKLIGTLFLSLNICTYESLECIEKSCLTMPGKPRYSQSVY